MTGWIIFGSIVLFLIWLFTRHVTVTGIYDAHPELRVRILFITLVKVPPDPAAVKRREEKERRKAERQAEKARKAELKKNRGVNTKLLEQDDGEKTDSEPEKQEKKKKDKGRSGFDFGLVTELVKSAGPPLKRLFRKIKFRDVYIDCVAGSDDAAVTALKYGGYCAAIYSLTELIDTYFDSQIREVNVEADFYAPKDDIFAHVTIKLRISTAIGCALWLGVRALKVYLKYSEPKTKNKANKRKRPAGARMKG